MTQSTGLHNDTPDNILKVHKVLEGPFDVVDTDGNEFWFIEAYVEHNDKYFDMTISSDEFDRIYDIVKHMKSPTLEPYIIEGDTS